MCCRSLLDWPTLHAGGVERDSNTEDKAFPVPHHPPPVIFHFVVLSVDSPPPPPDALGFPGWVKMDCITSYLKCGIARRHSHTITATGLIIVRLDVWLTVACLYDTIFITSSVIHNICSCEKIAATGKELEDLNGQLLLAGHCTVLHVWRQKTWWSHTAEKFYRWWVVPTDTTGLNQFDHCLL